MRFDTPQVTDRRYALKTLKATPFTAASILQTGAALVQRGGDKIDKTRATKMSEPIHTKLQDFNVIDSDLRFALSVTRHTVNGTADALLVHAQIIPTMPCALTTFVAALSARG